ncbi:MAG: hypothetical protein BTN85_1026 [Candidatus Methanohalarchaeum thermophilum]|uniref:Uncharacterized protein n=1 Tax=Methanohalarchaeum thermophilum TaxID=1903181 RepID=A0A1Q6DVX2_METT1|nr:MAG: hypothetical protein BTN85_1026 [Candidatus Methanohalarchaeum thermophilum]
MQVPQGLKYWFPGQAPMSITIMYLGPRLGHRAPFPTPPHIYCDRALHSSACPLKLGLYAKNLPTKTPLLKLPKYKYLVMIPPPILSKKGRRLRPNKLKFLSLIEVTNEKNKI